MCPACILVGATLAFLIRPFVKRRSEEKRRAAAEWRLDAGAEDRRFTPS